MNTWFGYPLASIACISFFAATADCVASESDTATDSYAATKMFYEEHWQDKIDTALAYIPGVIVSVNVDLIADDSTASRNLWLKSSGDSESQQIKNAGAQSRGEKRSQKRLTRRARNKTSTKVSTTVETKPSRVLRTKKNRGANAYIPQQVHVAVSVPNQYYHDVLKSRNSIHQKQADSTPTTPEKERHQIEADRLFQQAEQVKAIEDEIALKIKSTVILLLPSDPSKHKFPPISVQTFDVLSDIPNSTPTFQSR